HGGLASSSTMSGSRPATSSASSQPPWMRTSSSMATRARPSGWTSTWARTLRTWASVHARAGVGARAASTDRTSSGRTHRRYRPRAKSAKFLHAQGAGEGLELHLDPGVELAEVRLHDAPAAGERVVLPDPEAERAAGTLDEAILHGAERRSVLG